MKIRPYEEKGLPAMTAIRNEVVAAGVAFPQTEPLTLEEARSAIAETDSGEVAGLCILHPNHIVRCGHIANSPYAVSSARRGEHLGEARIRDCLHADWDCGFRLIQFNIVVASNTPAICLYEKPGSCPLGKVPGGFRLPGGSCEDILLFYHTLEDLT